MEKYDGAEDYHIWMDGTITLEGRFTKEDLNLIIAESKGECEDA